MIKGKYGAVIGRETRFYVRAEISSLCGIRLPITAAYLPLIIKACNFAKRQCKLLTVEWLTSPMQVRI
jgi:hypothetical protein